MNDKSQVESGAVRVSAHPGRRMRIFAVRREGHRDRHLTTIEPWPEVDVPETRSHRVRATT